jgi:hypothetical protein
MRSTRESGGRGRRVVRPLRANKRHRTRKRLSGCKLVHIPQDANAVRFDPISPQFRSRFEISPLFPTWSFENSDCNEIRLFLNGKACLLRTAARIRLKELSDCIGTRKCAGRSPWPELLERKAVTAPYCIVRYGDKVAIVSSRWSAPRASSSSRARPVLNVRRETSCRTT